MIVLSEGIQKFLFPASVGAGRFHQIGIPFPEFSAPFVGVIQDYLWLFSVVGAINPPCIMPLVVIILTAISTTKIPF